MIATRNLKLHLEEMPAFKQMVNKELGNIDKGKARRIEKDSISFQSLDQFRKFLTPKRVEIRNIRHRKPRSIYELARTPGNVNTDIKFLKEMWLVEISEAKDSRSRHGTV